MLGGTVTQGLVSHHPRHWDLHSPNPIAHTEHLSPRPIGDGEVRASAELRQLLAEVSSQFTLSTPSHRLSLPLLFRWTHFLLNSVQFSTHTGCLCVGDPRLLASNPGRNFADLVSRGTRLAELLPGIEVKLSSFRVFLSSSLSFRLR